MNAYRLLRSNKESGPYTAEQLISMGLKAYDLIWAEGKTEAWKYPSELGEFKMYAPALEEQPFNQFYTKKTTPDSFQYTVTKKDPVRDDIKLTETTIQNHQHPVQPEIKGVMIEIHDKKPEQPGSLFEIREKLPVLNTIPIEDVDRPAEKPRIKIKADTRKIQGTVSTASKPLVKEKEKKILLADGSLNWQSAWQDWEKERKGISTAPLIPVYQTNSSPFNEPVIETKFSQSLDDIKEKYIETVLQRKHVKGNTTHSFPVKYLLTGTAVVVILGLGFWIGASAGKPAKELHNLAVTDGPSTKQETGNAQTTNSLPADVTPSQDDKKTVVYTLPSANTQQTLHSRQKEKKLPADFKYAAASKEQVSKTAGKVQESTTASDYTPPVPDKPVNIVKKEETKPVFPITKTQTVNDFIKLGNNTIALNQNTVENTLQVRNISDIPFNLVVIDLQYYGADGHFRKGETLYLRNMNGGRSMNVKIPWDQSSVKVSAAVSMISSDQKNLYLIAE